MTLISLLQLKKGTIKCFLNLLYEDTSLILQVSPNLGCTVYACVTLNPSDRQLFRHLLSASTVRDVHKVWSTIILGLVVYLNIFQDDL